MSFAPDPKWESFVEREPLFAVLTAPKFLRANLTPDAEREFFTSGEELVDWIFHVIEHRLLPRFAPMTMLEFGCGVGRLAIPLARRPGVVTAADRSPAMMAAARARAARAGVDHIAFEAPQEVLRSARQFDLVVCFNVLQRVRPSDGVPLLRALTGHLATGGVGVFHVPFRTTAASWVRISRWARERVPGINGVGNLVLGKPFADPFIPSHVYDLDAVMRTLDELGIAASHVVFEHQQELSNAILFVEKPLPSITGVDQHGRPLPGTQLIVRETAPAPIDVKQVIASTSIEDLNRTAEEYFASITDWDDQLAKPFSKPVDAPPLLSNLGTLLHGLQLRPGARVLEFGAGTGWLSRALTQLGCEVILLDVSPSALAIARQLYERVPVVGSRPAPRFLEFDGRRIALGDAAVDRIVSFDAFHHVPNPEDVLREMARVLKPGGIAGFSEPGARHSDTPMSQFEMRTYQVVENDIDVHAIWRAAASCGFRDVQLALFHGPPFYVSLAEYEDFLAGGQTVERWTTATRVFLRHVRNFFLVREGEEPQDSRTVRGLSCVIAGMVTAPALAGRPITIDAEVKNTGTATWLPHDAPYGGVRLGGHLYDASGTLVDFEIYGEPLTDPPRPIAPGETVRTRLTVPPRGPGRYRLELDCVATHVTWFAQVGAGVASIDLSVA